MLISNLNLETTRELENEPNATVHEKRDLVPHLISKHMPDSISASFSTMTSNFLMQQVQLNVLKF